MLKLEHVYAGYGDLKVLHDICMEVRTGEVVALVGANGAGKTTLLQILSGFVPITSGTIEYMGKDLLSVPASKRAELGIAHIPQGRGILGKLSVRENLYMGAYSNQEAKRRMKESLEQAYAAFPILYERRNQAAGSLSGGEQQLLAISRALMMQPKMIIMDEPSLGLAPIFVDEVFRIIQRVSKSGVSILIVEQNLVKSLQIAHRGYVLETGAIVMEGPGAQLLGDRTIKAKYLGIEID